MDFPPSNPRDVDFTEMEAILRIHEHPPFGAYVEAVMGRILDARVLAGWEAGALARAARVIARYALPALLLVLFAPPLQSQDCTTDDAKGEAVGDFLEEHYGPVSLMAYPSDQGPGLIEVYFHPYKPQERDCEGVVKVDDECRITTADGTSLNDEASREHVFRCTL